MRPLFELLLLFIIGMGAVAVYRLLFGSSPKKDEPFKKENEM